MADIIRTIGTTGADFTTIQQWWSARTGGAGDRYIGEIIDTGSVSSGSTLTGPASVDALGLRAATAIRFNPESPSTPCATLPGITFTTTTPVVYEFLDIASSSTTLTAINTSTTVANTTVRNCRIRGGRYGVANSVSGATLLVENCIIQDSARIGVYNFFAGATIRNTVIVNCSTESGTSSSYGGVRKDMAGTVLDNVVCFNNGNLDFFGATTTATVSFLASEDASATGSNAITGITSAAFTNYAGGVFTAATGGVLDGTGPSGNDRGLVIGGAPAIYITTPVAWQLNARNPSTNAGSISIVGTYANGTPTAIEARWSGGAWTTIDAAPSSGNYSGTLSGLSVGNGDLEVRFANNTAVTASAANVAIGAKFLFWGQSNFSGRADNAQNYTGTAGWFHKYTVTNNQWQQGADPFDTETASGSLFPLLANYLTAAIGCPVGFIGVAKGSTALSAWQPGQTLNNRMIDYYNAATANSSGGIEAVVSWIGESDADAATSETNFKNRYNTVINQLKTLTGKDSLLVAPSGLNNTNYANVRQWISDIAETSANTAPNEVQMWPLFQKIHYETNIETALAADAVFDGLYYWLYADLFSISVSGQAGSFTSSISLDYQAPAGVNEIAVNGSLQRFTSSIELEYFQPQINAASVSGQIQSFTAIINLDSSGAYPQAKSGQTFNAYVRGL
jgi:hypothetical protein